MPSARSSSSDARLVASRVREYFASVPPASRAVLRKMRETIRGAAPDAVEHFSYRMPAFRLDGKVLVWYAAFTHHVSLFPMTAGIQRTLARELEGFETSKGTIRFPLARPLPVALVKRLVKARIAEVRGAS